MTEEEREWWSDYVQCRNRTESAGRWGFLGGVVAVMVGNAVQNLYGIWWSLPAFGVAGAVVSLFLVRHERKLALELVGDPPGQPEHERIY